MLWTYRTTPRKSTGKTPFSITYGVEVVIPIKSGFPNLRTDQFNVEENNRLLLTSLELVEKGREVVVVKMTHY